MKKLRTMESIQHYHGINMETYLHKYTATIFLQNFQERDQIESLQEIGELLEILNINQEEVNFYNTEDPDAFFCFGKSSKNQYLTIIYPYQNGKNLEVFSLQNHMIIPK